MATILDVARMAGVSRTTVSRVLNDSPRVDRETREKVLAAMRKLNYQPSLAARNLRKQETKLIAVLIPTIANPFFARLVEGMEQVAAGKGYNIILCNTGDDPGRELQFIRMLEQKQADGVILTALRNPADVVKQYLKYGPIVLACEYLDDNSLPAVTIDNCRAAKEAAEHLIAWGHRKIAYLNGPEHIILCRDRKKGYTAALEDHGLPVDNSLILHSNFTIAGGYDNTCKLLRLKDRPTAIFAANDDMAVGAIKAIREHGLRVPEDVAVVGFDNNQISTVIEPQVTTVDQPIYRLGARVAELMLECLENPALVAVAGRIVLAARLCIRQSSVPRHP